MNSTEPTAKNIVHFSKTVPPSFKGTITQFLTQELKLSGSLCKKILNFGGCHLKEREKGPTRRLRKATYSLRPGMIIDLHYDPGLSYAQIDQIILMQENKNFAVWFKPAGVLTQGTLFGDQGTLEREVELITKIKPFIIHRLDRETAGPVIVAYDKETAAQLSRAFSANEVTKRYRALASGDLTVKWPKSGEFRFSLDGKECVTKYDVLSCKENQSLVDLLPLTGRTHQLRRHLEIAGFPIMGDPLYGKGNKNQEGLQLFCYALDFPHPFKKQRVVVEVPVNKRPKELFPEV